MVAVWHWMPERCQQAAFRSPAHGFDDVHVQGEGQSPALPSTDRAPIAGASSLKLDPLLGHRVKVCALPVARLCDMLLCAAAPTFTRRIRCPAVLLTEPLNFCHLQVYWATAGGWWDGVITDFNAVTGQHWCGPAAFAICQPCLCAAAFHASSITPAQHQNIHELAHHAPPEHSISAYAVWCTTTARRTSPSSGRRFEARRAARCRSWTTPSTCCRCL